MTMADDFWVPLSNPSKGVEATLNRIARALERLADAQQQIAEQGEPVDEEVDYPPSLGHLGQRDG